ncbi:probable pre-mRNA-splicing factor ATP-dependent RNA helicase DEAH4 isoform X2, partial [Tanacetum coccineum]
KKCQTGKLFPVEILCSAEQPKSYIESSLRKAIDIHVNEPEGDILIFMTGQELVSRLEEKIQSLEVGSCMDAVVLPLHGSLPPEMEASSILLRDSAARKNSSKHTDKKRKQPPSELPDGSGWGDHIQLLQIYELWDQTDYSTDWVKDNNLQVRGMLFVKNERKQLCQIMQKFAKGYVQQQKRYPKKTVMHRSLDVRRKERRRDRQNDYKNLRKSLCVGYASQLAERMMRHNGYRTVGFKSQLVQVHPSSVLRTDDEGVFPNYVVYHELISTSHPYMRNVCEVEMEWVTPILQKLKKLNVKILSGIRAKGIKTTQQFMINHQSRKPAMDEKRQRKEERERNKGCYSLLLHKNTERVHQNSKEEMNRFKGIYLND